MDKDVFVADGHAWRLQAVPVDPPGAARCVEGVEGRLDLAPSLGDTPALWLVQARAASGSVARPAVWSVNPPPFSTRDARIAGYAEDWRRLLGTPANPGWDVRSQLIRAAHDGGDAGALDQVQALGEVPAAAVVLLFRVPEADLASALALEGEAPIWWPVVPVTAWTAAVAAAQDRSRGLLRAAGFDAKETAEMANETLAQRAGAILALRPEVRGHLGAAFASSDILPIARSDYLAGGALPLAMPNAANFLWDLIQEAARRDTMPPEGTAGLPAARLSRATSLPEHLRALLDAPLVAAEIATGLIPHPDITLLIRLIALRQADPIWSRLAQAMPEFDYQLPLAVRTPCRLSPIPSRPRVENSPRYYRRGAAATEHRLDGAIDREEAARDQSEMGPGRAPDHRVSRDWPPRTLRLKPRTATTINLGNEVVMVLTIFR